jgi:SAM-dependent methyltransferase
MSPRSIKLLDIGCGNGINLTIPLGNLGINILGIDPHPPSITAANNINTNAGVEFNCIPIASVEDNSFDFVILSEVLEHLKNPDEMLSNIKRVLRPRGICFLSVPNGQSVKEIEMRIYKLVIECAIINKIPLLKSVLKRLYHTGGSEDDDSIHIQFFSYNEICQLMASNGFQIINEQNSRLLGGFFINRILLISSRLIYWNYSIAEKLPKSYVTGWIFAIQHIQTYSQSK